MSPAAEDRQLRERIRRIERLLKEVDQFQDPHAQAHTREIVQALMDMHGAAIGKMLELLSAEPTGSSIIDSLANDEMVSGLLLLYGLHPLDIATRVANALEQVRPYLRSHGGNVELISLSEGLVRLRLQGSCHGCPSSAATLKQTIEEAIYDKAPDVTNIEVEADPEPENAEPHLVESHSAGRFALPILK
jgi:Fe-S cluster biogenesis protein NfuA